MLRIEQRTGPLPKDFPYDKAESTLDYDFVRIESQNYLLPVHSENLACQRGSYNCTRNEISFRNYRKFTSDTNIKFEKSDQLGAGCAHNASATRCALISNTDVLPGARCRRIGSPPVLT